MLARRLLAAPRRASAGPERCNGGHPLRQLRALQDADRCAVSMCVRLPHVQRAHEGTP